MCVGYDLGNPLRTCDVPDTTLRPTPSLQVPVKVIGQNTDGEQEQFMNAVGS